MKQLLKAVLMLVGVSLAILLVMFLVSYGEYMATTTGNMWWLLFYVPHVVWMVWYIKLNANRG